MKIQTEIIAYNIIDSKSTWNIIDPELKVFNPPNNANKINNNNNNNLFRFHLYFVPSCSNQVSTIRTKILQNHCSLYPFSLAQKMPYESVFDITFYFNSCNYVSIKDRLDINSNTKFIHIFYLSHYLAKSWF